MISSFAVDSAAAEARIATMIDSIDQLRGVHISEAFLDWQRIDLNRRRPVIEQSGDAVATSIWSRGRAHFARRLRRRIRRRVAPRGLRRLRRQLMPTAARLQRRLRRVAGLPTARKIRRRLGVRRILRPEMFSDRLVNRMARVMSEKLKWR